MYVCGAKGWRQFQQSGKEEKYKDSGKCVIDNKQGHPCDGKVKGNWLYTHHKYNLCKMISDHQQGTQVRPTEIEIKTELEQTRIYSDGSAHSDDKKGACATIVSSGKKHYVQTLSLRGEQGKSSYRAELEGIYLGTKTASAVYQSGTEWSYWTDRMLAIMQCGKQHLSTKDMTAPEADIVLAIRHSLKSQGVKGKFNLSTDTRMITLNSVH